jgi:hypothetical protein
MPKQFHAVSPNEPNRLCVSPEQIARSEKDRLLLIFQCRQLVDKISKKKQYLKLLIAAKNGLTMISEYKNNR